ncbi:hypothetical protein PL329_13515 [Escherichia coli]|uniref:hypothetical protein n=1 Tax=Escherichia coli TaxID=562 RepID=UPI0023072564|nr:hypothetical protein [Escherichia coli]WCE52085.1 hypothetical protein PL329_13515 [Escherichia coli]
MITEATAATTTTTRQRCRQRLRKMVLLVTGVNDGAYLQQQVEHETVHHFFHRRVVVFLVELLERSGISNDVLCRLLVLRAVRRVVGRGGGVE